LTKQEVLNLFYVHRYANYYEEIEQAMMTADSIVMLITNRVEFLKSDDPAAPEDVKLDTPSERWKELIGDKDPAVAKENGQLRGKYGKDVI
jgi:nucleoside diphosphate kinase